MKPFVMSSYFPNFISGDWIFAKLKELSGKELGAFVNSLPVSMIQPYVLNGILMNRSAMLEVSKDWRQLAVNRLVETGIIWDRDKWQP